MTQRNRVHPVETFSGFERPEDNFNRAPNSWFDAWIWVRGRLEAEAEAEAGARGIIRPDNSTGSDRIVGLLKCMIYITKHTFGVQNYTQPIRLSGKDFHDGRPKYRGASPDHGVGLNHTTLASALERLHNLGLITLSVDSSDSARITKHILPRIAPGKGGLAPVIRSGGNFNGFDDPRANYWIQPDEFTDLIRPLKRATTILGVQYLFRHSWSWYGQDGFRDIWVGLSADEIANGKYLRNADGSLALGPDRSPIRLDNGIGYTVRNVHSGMTDAVEAGLVVYRVRVNPLTHLEEREYLLRRKGQPAGEWRSETQSPVQASNGAAGSEKDKTAEINPSTDVASRGRDVISRGSDVISAAKDVTSRGGDVVSSIADVAVTGADVTSSGADVINTGADVAANRTYKPTNKPSIENPPPPPPTQTRPATPAQNGIANGIGGGGGGLQPGNLFFNKGWDAQTRNAFVVTVDLLRHIGFSRQTALKLAEPWVTMYTTEGPYSLAKWLVYHETSPGLDPNRRGGFIRVKLENLEDPPQNISAPPTHDIMRFLSRRFEECESHGEDVEPELLPFPTGWWQALEQERAEREKEVQAQEAERVRAEEIKVWETYQNDRAAQKAAHTLSQEQQRAQELAARREKALQMLRLKHCLDSCEPSLEFLLVWDKIVDDYLGARWRVKLVEVSQKVTKVFFEIPVTALGIASFICEARGAVDAGLLKAGWGALGLTWPEEIEESDIERWLIYREMVDDYALKAWGEGRLDRLTVSDLPRLWPRSFDADIGRMVFRERDVARKDKGRVGADLAALLSPVFGVAVAVEWV